MLKANEEEIIINGKVYIRNTETGATRPKEPDMGGALSTASTAANTKTPFDEKQTEIPIQNQGGALSQSLDNQRKMTNEYQDSLYNQVTSTAKSIQDTQNNLNDFSNVTIPTKPEYKQLTDSEGNQIDYVDAVPDWETWKAQNNWSLPSPSDEKYQVDPENYKKTKTKKQQWGDRLYILGAMFQELGNPKMYAGATAEAGAVVKARDSENAEIALEEYQEAVAVAKASYEGDFDLALELAKGFDKDVEQFDNVIKAIQADNAQIDKDFDNAIKIFDKEVNLFKEQNQVILEQNNLEISKLELLPKAIKEALNAEGTMFDAIVEGVDLRDKMRNSNKEDVEFVEKLSQQFTDMNTSGNAMFGNSWESKLQLIKEAAGDNELAKIFVDNLPATQEEYFKKEASNLMDHAENFIAVAQSMGLGEDDSTYLMYEKILGANINFDITKQDEIDPFELTDAERSKLKDSIPQLRDIINQTNSLYGQLEANPSLAGIQNVMANSGAGRMLLNFASILGVDLKTEGILTDLQEFSSDTQLFNTQYASLAAQLIGTFTGDEGAKRTTWEQQFSRKIAGVVGNDSLDRWFQSPENQKTFLRIMNETVTEALEENNKILAENRFPSTIPQEEEGYVDNIKGDAEQAKFGTMTETDVANFQAQMRTSTDYKSLFTDPEMVKSLNDPSNKAAKDKIVETIKEISGLEGTELIKLLQQLGLSG